MTVADLPPDLVERWVSPDGTHRVEVIPRANLADEAALRAFVADVRSVAPDATGGPVTSVSAGEAVVSAFRQALAYAAMATLLLLLLALRSFWDTMRVIVPLASRVTREHMSALPLAQRVTMSCAATVVITLSMLILK